MRSFAVQRSYIPRDDESKTHHRWTNSACLRRGKARLERSQQRMFAKNLSSRSDRFTRLFHRDLPSNVVVLHRTERCWERWLPSNKNHRDILSLTTSVHFNEQPVKHHINLIQHVRALALLEVLRLACQLRARTGFVDVSRLTTHWRFSTCFELLASQAKKIFTDQWFRLAPPDTGELQEVRGPPLIGARANNDAATLWLQRFAWPAMIVGLSTMSLLYLLVHFHAELVNTIIWSFIADSWVGWFWLFIFFTMRGM